MEPVQAVSFAVRNAVSRRIREFGDARWMLQDMLARGLLPAEGVQPAVSPVPPSSLETFIEARRRDMRRFSGGVLEDVAFPVILKGWEALRCFFSFRFYAQGVEASLVGSGVAQWIDADFAQYVTDFSVFLLEVAQWLQQETQPALSSVEGPITYDYAVSHFHRAVTREIGTLDWVNFFGVKYVEKYGRDFLLGIPGWQSGDLPDGGVYYRSRQDFLIRDPQAFESWQQSVRSYFARAGIDQDLEFPVL